MWGCDVSDIYKLNEKNKDMCFVCISSSKPNYKLNFDILYKFLGYLLLCPHHFDMFSYFDKNHNKLEDEIDKLNKQINMVRRKPNEKNS